MRDPLRRGTRTGIVNEASREGRQFSPCVQTTSGWCRWAGSGSVWHGLASYCDGGGQACYVPGVIPSQTGSHVVLPTRWVVEGLVDPRIVAAELQSVWEALPERGRQEIAANNSTGTVTTARDIIALSKLTPHRGLPGVPDPTRMPAFWDDFVREHKARWIDERNACIVELYKEGWTKADVACALGIPSSKVSTVLSRADVAGERIGTEAQARTQRRRRHGPANRS